MKGTGTRAREYFAVGKYQEALELYGKLYAETLHPTYLRNIGRCYQNLGEPKLAISSFREYLRKAKNLEPEKRKEVEDFIAEMEALKRSQEAAAQPSSSPVPAIAEAAASASAQPPRKRGLTGTQITGLVVSGVGVVAPGAGSGAGELNVTPQYQTFCATRRRAVSRLVFTTPIY